MKSTDDLFGDRAKKGIQQEITGNARFLPLAMVLSTLFGCGLGDISVTNDVGEKLIIPSSSITVLEENGEKLAKFREERNKDQTFQYDKCVKEYNIGAKECWRIFGKHITPEEKLSEIRKLPPMNEVLYKIIFVDLNGHKTVSDNKSKLCPAKGQEKNHEDVEKLLGIDRFKDKSVLELVAERKLCDRFGK